MKHFIYLLVVTLFIGGCSYKNEPVNLHVYKGEYSGEVLKNSQTVYLRSVQDDRADTKEIGYTLKDDKKSQFFYSDVDFSKRYAEGLKYALDIAGFNPVSNAGDASLILDVKIKKIQIVYNDKSFDQNLMGELEVQVLITKGQKVTTVNFNPKASEWMAPSYDSKDIEPFLYTLFSDNINSITAKLTTY